MLGFGVALRFGHLDYVLSADPKVDWLEVPTEYFFSAGGRLLRSLDELAAQYPLVLHGVSLGIGNPGRLDTSYVRKVRSLARRTRAVIVSDHVCWTGTPAHSTHQLLPFPYTERSLAYVTQRVNQVQDILGQQLVLENPAAYISFATSTMPEPEFLGRMSSETGCGLLVDVANIAINASNHGFDSFAYVRAIPRDRVLYFHLSGYSRRARLMLDSHGGPIPEAVWKLYRYACELIGRRSTLIEWEADLPSFDILEEQLERARAESLKAASTGRSLPALSSHANGGPKGRRRLQRRPVASSISTVQQWLHRQIVKPQSIEAKDTQDVSVAGRQVRPSRSTSLHDCLTVYSRDYREKLEASLASDFTAVSAVLGKHPFARLLSAYLTQYPPRGFSLRKLGFRLPEHVRRLPSFPAKQLVYDLARLEVTQMKVFDAPSVASLMPSSRLFSSRADWHRPLTTIPAFRLLALRTQAAQVASAVYERRPRPRLDPVQNWIAVHRSDYTIHRTELTRASWVFYRALQNGTTIAQAANQTRSYLGRNANIDQIVHEWLREGCKLGFFAAIQSSSAAVKPQGKISFKWVRQSVQARSTELLQMS